MYTNHGQSFIIQKQHNKKYKNIFSLAISSLFNICQWKYMALLVQHSSPESAMFCCCLLKLSCKYLTNKATRIWLKFRKQHSFCTQQRIADIYPDFFFLLRIATECSHLKLRWSWKEWKLSLGSHWHLTSQMSDLILTVFTLSSLLISVARLHYHHCSFQKPYFSFKQDESQALYF